MPAPQDDPPGQGGHDTWGKMLVPQGAPPGQEGHDTWGKMPGP